MWSKKYGSGWLSYYVKEPAIKIYLDGRYATSAEWATKAVATAIAIAIAGKVVTAAAVGKLAGAAGMTALSFADDALDAALEIGGIKFLQSSNGSITLVW
jgi:hypothetical protein